jgi:hypothetical protein
MQSAGRATPAPAFPAVADLRGSQISSMEDLNMSTQLRTVIVRPDQLSQEEKNRLRPQVPIE